MSTDFNWQTEEDVAWEEPVPAPPPHRRRGPWWLWLILVLMAVGVSVGLMVDRRVEESVAAQEAEAAAVFQLLVRADEIRDRELLQTVLDTSDRGWAAAQLDLVEEGLLFDRSAWGWAPAGPVTMQAITLTNDLEMATLVSQRAYDVHRPYGDVIQATLTFTISLAHNGQGWRYTPPPPTSATWVRDRHQLVEVTYRRRDEAIGAELVRQLQSVLTNLCQLENCDLATMPLRLTFTDDPAQLAANTPFVLTLEGRELTFPSPWLFGRPADDAGRQRLIQHYVIQTAHSWLAERWGYQCCEHGLFMQALFDQQLAPAELTVLPPARLPRDSDLLLAQIANWWQAPATALPQPDQGNITWLYRFLRTQRPHLDMATLARTMVASETFVPDGSFDTWLAAMAGPNVEWPAVSERWHHFVQNQTYLAGADTPPYPEQDLLLSCRGLETYTLWRLDPGPGRWTPELEVAGVNIAHLRALPGGEGYNLQVRLNAGGLREAREYVSRPGQSIVFAPEGDSGRIFVQNVTPPPAGLMRTLAFTGTNGTFSIQNGVTNLNACTDGECPFTPLPGYPIWSPDGAYQLLVDAFRFNDPYTPSGNIRALFLKATADENDDSWPLGQGRDPVWLGPSQFVYLTPGRAYGFDVIYGSVDEAGVSVNRASAAVVSGGRVDAFTSIFADPADPAAYYAVGGGLNGRLLLHIGAEPHTITTLPGGITPARPTFSSDGRYLSIHDTVLERVYLVDLVYGPEATPWVIADVQQMDWSADGQWLVYVSEQDVYLWAPAYTASAHTAIDGANCQGAIWVNEYETVPWPEQ